MLCMQCLGNFKPGAQPLLYPEYTGNTYNCSGCRNIQLLTNVFLKSLRTGVLGSISTIRNYLYLRFCLTIIYFNGVGNFRRNGNYQLLIGKAQLVHIISELMVSLPFIMLGINNRYAGEFANQAGGH